MNRTRTSTLDAFGLRDQRNRIYPTMEGSDGSTLSLDFTAMSSLDSRFTFSRTSPATFINSTGYVAWGDTNLVRDSMGFAVASGSSKGWGTAGTVTQVADRYGVSANASRASYTQTGSISISWSSEVPSSAFISGAVMRFWVRGVTNPGRIDVGWYQASTGWGSVSDGACSIVAGYSAGVTISSVTGVLFRIDGLSTSEWTQIEVKRSTRADYFAMYFGGAAATGQTHAFEFCEFQAHSGPVAKSFVATSGEASNGAQAPRFEYNPTTLRPRGLLIEGSATNLLCWSEAFDTTGATVNWNWSALNVTRGTVTATDPRGSSSTVVKIQETSATGIHGTLIVPSASINTAYTASVFAKAAERSYLQLFDNGGSSANAMVNLSSGAVVSESTAGITVVTAMPNGWYRIAMRLTTGGSQTSVNFQLRLSTDGSTTSYAGTTGSGIYIWGAQLEAGSGASSYIPTTVSTVTRSPDSAVMGNIVALNYSTTNGTLYWKGQFNKRHVANTYSTLIGFMTATISPDQPTLETFPGGSNPDRYFAAARGPSLSAGGSNEVAINYPLSTEVRYAASVNTLVSSPEPIIQANLNGTTGSAVKTGSGDLHSATRFVLGRQPSSSYGGNYPSVTIASVKYWPTSSTAAQLALLTNP